MGATSRRSITLQASYLHSSFLQDFEQDNVEDEGTPREFFRLAKGVARYNLEYFRFEFARATKIKA